MADDLVLKFSYNFFFDNDEKVIFDIYLDSDTLRYIPAKDRVLPKWTKLEAEPCEGCTIQDQGSNHCPVAANIADVVEAFKDVVSFDKIDVIINTEERSFFKEKIPSQRAVSSLLGLIMATSGCKDLDKLRPMARFHLPFASIQETVYRAVSMYLVAQYFRYKRDLEPDWDMKGLKGVYKKIAQVNANICKRLQIATSEDASLNAVVILDTFAQMMPFTIDDTLKEFEYLFSPYLTAE